MDLLYECFDEWKYKHFDLYDENEEDLNEDLNIELDACLYDFLTDTSHELYAKRISKQLNLI